MTLRTRSPSFVLQLNQALAGKFNGHVHVEYEWRLQHEDLDESDEDLDEKVGGSFLRLYLKLLLRSKQNESFRCTLQNLKKKKRIQENH